MQPSETIHKYGQALKERDLNAIGSLFAPQALLDLPLLGRRLIGRNEIRAGFAKVFLATQSCELAIGELRSSGTVAIGEGRLYARPASGDAVQTMPMSIVIETAPEGITRLSFYLDAHPYRLWSDGLIAADS